MNIVEYNSKAWDKAVDEEDDWTRPVSSEAIADARCGNWSVLLTPEKAVPRSWFGEIKGKDVLCLASGGGQQSPILSAAGANVTSLDNSEKQIEQDRFVADRDGLAIRLERGEAADLSRFLDLSFDLIFNPCSNLFMPALVPVWRECFRVLRRGGTILVGFLKPEVFIFDRFCEETYGVLRVRHPLPYADSSSLSEAELAELIAEGEPLEYSHSLEDQIGGQTDAGFQIIGLYEDSWPGPGRRLNDFMPTFVATRALKP